MYESLKNKKVLVTGGASGIGRAIVERFLKEGSIVYVVDIDEKAISQPYSKEPEKCIVLDVANEKIVFKKLSSLKIDILVNNAAITGGDDYVNVMNVNCNGVRYVTETLLTSMIKRGYGSVIFITSVHTAVPFRNDAAYDMSKHALVGYMKARALELASLGIRLNAVAPGAIKNAGPNHDAKLISKNNKSIPVKRHGSPEEIANVVAFLSSDEASYVIGAEWRVDGGLSISGTLS